MSESESPTAEYSSPLDADGPLDADALRTLYMAEMGGEAFYNAFAAQIGNDTAAELLRRNAREEAGHARRIGRAIELKLGSAFEPPAPVDPSAITLPDPIDAAFFQRLIDGEIAGDAKYANLAEHEPDAEVARLYRLNGREESIHAGRVEEVMALLATS
jgi:rubrerythrin